MDKKTNNNNKYKINLDEDSFMAKFNSEYFLSDTDSDDELVNQESKAEEIFRDINSNNELMNQESKTEECNLLGGADFTS